MIISVNLSNAQAREILKVFQDNLNSQRIKESQKSTNFQNDPELPSTNPKNLPLPLIFQNLKIPENLTKRKLEESFTIQVCMVP